MALAVALLAVVARAVSLLAVVALAATPLERRTRPR
jgi:hypothetical protein